MRTPTPVFTTKILTSPSQLRGTGGSGRGDGSKGTVRVGQGDVRGKLHERTNPPTVEVAPGRVGEYRRHRVGPLEPLPHSPL